MWKICRSLLKTRLSKICAKSKRGECSHMPLLRMPMDRYMCLQFELLCHNFKRLLLLFHCTLKCVMKAAGSGPRFNYACCYNFCQHFPGLKFALSTTKNMVRTPSLTLLELSDLTAKYKTLKLKLHFLPSFKYFNMHYAYNI